MTVKNKKIVLSAGIAPFIVLFIVFAIVLTAKSLKKPEIAFYGVDERTELSIKSVIDGWNKRENIKFKYKTLDSEKSLDTQISIASRPDILITTNGAAVIVAAENASAKAAIDSTPLSEMTTSMRGVAILSQDKTKTAAAPLLSSHFEIDIDLDAFRASRMKAIATWKDIDQFLKIEKKNFDYPLIFAGKDSSTTLDLLGAMTESLDGTEQYRAAANLIENYITEKRWDAPDLAQELCGSYNAPLYTSVKKLSEWYAAGLLSKDCFNYTFNDVNAFLQNKFSAAAFMTLSDHRKINTKTAEHFSSIYVPSERSAGERRFTAQVIYAVPQKRNKRLSKLVSYFLSSEGQEQLSRSTGLAPVFAHCRTPDHQADDARYWIAATSTPLAGLSRETDLTRKHKDQLAAELASIIKSGQIQ